MVFVFHNKMKLMFLKRK